MLPDLVWAGGILTAAAQFVAMFFTSLLVHRAAEGYGSDVLAPFQAINEGLPYGAWTPMALTVSAFAVAGLRRRAVARALGAFSALIAVLMLVVTATDLLAANWFLVAAWLMVSSITLAFARSPAHTTTES